MWFKNPFKGNAKPPVAEDKSRSDINQGVFYLYLIIGMQVFLVFGLMAVITAFGTVMATPMWVFLFALIMGISGCVYIYRKAKQKLRKIQEAFSQVNLSNRNYEISIMGGVFTMRVEQNPTPPLLEAPSNSVLDAEPGDPPVSGQYGR
jgi:hypothetical protein